MFRLPVVPQGEIKLISLKFFFIFTLPTLLANQHRLPALIFTKNMFSTNRIFKIHTQGLLFVRILRCIFDKIYSLFLLNSATLASCMTPVIDHFFSSKKL